MDCLTVRGSLQQRPFRPSAHALADWLSRYAGIPASTENAAFFRALDSKRHAQL